MDRPAATDPGEEVEEVGVLFVPAL